MEKNNEYDEMLNSTSINNTNQIRIINMINKIKYIDKSALYNFSDLKNEINENEFIQLMKFEEFQTKLSEYINNELKSENLNKKEIKKKIKLIEYYCKKYYKKNKKENKIIESLDSDLSITTSFIYNILAIFYFTLLFGKPILRIFITFIKRH